MNSEVIKRSILLVATFFMLTQCCFLILYYAPDSPFISFSLKDAYIYYFSHLSRGDFGMSFTTNLSLVTQLQQCIPVTLEIFFYAFLVSIAVGVPLGLIAGMKQNKWQDIVIKTAGLLISSSPIMWVSMIAILLFSPHTATSLDYGQLPMKHITGFLFIDVWIDNSPERLPLIRTIIRHLWLPIAVLSLYTSMIMIYFLSDSTAGIIKKNYIKAAATRGLSLFHIVVRHILPNAFPRIIPQLILQLPLVLFMTMVIEIVFKLPGFGYWSLQAYKMQDAIALSAGMLVMGTLAILANLAANIAAAVITPLNYKDWYVSD